MFYQFLIHSACVLEFNSKFKKERERDILALRKLKYVHFVYT